MIRTKLRKNTCNYYGRVFIKNYLFFTKDQSRTTDTVKVFSNNIRFTRFVSPAPFCLWCFTQAITRLIKTW